jgi:hypothetical protein
MLRYFAQFLFRAITIIAIYSFAGVVATRLGPVSSAGHQLMNNLQIFQVGVSLRLFPRFLVQYNPNSKLRGWPYNIRIGQCLFKFARPDPIEDTSTSSLSVSVITPFFLFPYSGLVCEGTFRKPRNF